MARKSSSDGLEGTDSPEPCENMGITALFALLTILAESVGAFALITGFFARLAAISIGVNMTVAAVMGHVQNGFFMNWFGKQAGEGFEFHILALAAALALVVKGGGLWSLDGWISGSRKPESCQTKKMSIVPYY
jgi:putative oxidoreductase